MATDLSTSLKAASSDATRELPGEALALIARARVSVSSLPAERDQALAAIVVSYRAGPRGQWAPVLLDLLNPALLDCLQRLGEEPPVFDREDLRQQLVVDLLHLAATLPLGDGRYLKRRLIRRANQAVRRWLTREASRQSRQISLAESEGPWR
jgi:hypothetical protein